MSSFDTWLHDLEGRHLADLRFAEVSRALRALSSTYVERRRAIQDGAALSGAGKRAAFALFYGPLHYLTISEVVRRLDAAPVRRGTTIIDLGCGTGASGAAWAGGAPGASPVVAIDRHPWALSEATRTYRHFNVPVRSRQADFTSADWPGSPAAFLAAFAINEVPVPARDRLLERLIERTGRGDAVLIVEPLARSAVPWWREWAGAFAAAGGRADEWRFRVDLPDIVARLDRAAGLNHRELTARTLWVPPR
jgi:SAM-dependent methyltransferase